MANLSGTGDGRSTDSHAVSVATVLRTLCGVVIFAGGTVCWIAIAHGDPTLKAEAFKALDRMLFLALGALVGTIAQTTSSRPQGTEDDPAHTVVDNPEEKPVQTETVNLNDPTRPSPP